MRKRKFKFTTAEAFGAALMKEADVLFPKYVKEHIVGIVTILYETTVMYTPVLTGRARTNWILTPNAPSKLVIDGLQSIKDEGYWHSSTGEPLTSTERQVLEGAAIAIRQGKVGAKWFLSNNLGYIGLLEDGSSSKAPAGMLSISIDWTMGVAMRKKIAQQAEAMR